MEMAISREPKSASWRALQELRCLESFPSPRSIFWCLTRLALVLFSVSILSVCGEESDRAKVVEKRIEKELKEALGDKGLSYGSPVFIRIFKEERELELWVRGEEGKFTLFRTYPVAGMSGTLGPKLAEGDGQAPEGFYFVPESALHPKSNYHLAFNIGFPNRYDRSHERTGSFIMVHGSDLSIGCFAMTDEKIEEIYTLAAVALREGQPFFRVHIFPFRMTEERMKKAEDDQAEWFEFWENLAEGYRFFEEEKRPPNVEVEEKHYLFEESEG